MTKDILSDLEDLVSIESPSDEPERVSAAAEWVVERLAQSGIAARRIPSPPCGDAVSAGIGPDADRGGTLLVGHLDTVWPVGTLAQRPFRVSDGFATGPGAFDMKAGIVVAIRALERLVREPDPPRASLFLTPDEEIGTRASRGELLREAKRHRRVLVLEPSRGGAAKVARKGTGLFEIVFAGRAAHAGLEPEKGASALAEMSRFALYLETLGDPSAGTTVTPTIASSGAKSNVVPEHARLAVDVRVWTVREQERVREAMAAYASHDSRVGIAISGGFDRPPMESSEESTALYETARRIAAATGWELGAERVGGASDGNLTAAEAIPTLDGLGPDGGGAHAVNERVRVADLDRRVDFLFNLVRELR